MCGSGAGEASGLGFDHGAKVVATQGSLLLKMGSDGFQVVVGQGSMQQLAIGLGARFGCASERGVWRVCREGGIKAEPAMRGSARPWKSCGVIGHAGAQRVEFDIAVAMQHVAFGVDQAGFVAAFPQCSGTPVTRVELTHIATPEFLHMASDRSDFWWRSQRMDVVIHQYVRVQSAPCVEQCFAKLRQVMLPIVVVAKAGQAIVATLNNVLRNTGQVESRLSGHRIRIGGSMPLR